MKNLSTQEAIEDINFIKNVINKTSLSLVSLSKVFTQLGIMFLAMSIILIVGGRVPVPFISVNGNINLYGKLLMILSIILSISMIVAPVLICIKILTKNQLMGLSKQIIFLWIYILVINTCLNILSILPCGNLNSLLTIQLLTFSLGLLSIFIFARFRFPLVLAVVYTVIALVTFVLNTPASPIILILPAVTLIITGVYLKYVRTKVV